jgi:hypothetical protein
MIKRVFVIFAIDDRAQKIHFTELASREKRSYKFVEMPIKDNWDHNEWKQSCESRIKGCDGAIVLVSEKLKKSTAAIWKVQRVKKVGLRLRGIYINGGSIKDKPKELDEVLCNEWRWENIKAFIQSL